VSQSWFSKNLGDALLAEGLLDDVEKLFQAEYTKSNSPNDMAMFVRHESEGRLHCELVAYFSPASILVARKVGATLCAVPSSNDLSLKAGSEVSWLLLFPGTTSGQK